MKKEKQHKLDNLLERICIIGYLGNVLIVTVEEWDEFTRKPSCIRKVAKLEVDINNGEVAMLKWIPGITMNGFIFIDPQYVNFLSFDIDIPYLKLYLKLFYGLSEKALDEDIKNDKVIELFDNPQEFSPEDEMQMSQTVDLNPPAITEIKNYIETQIKNNYKKLENKLLKAINNLYEEINNIKEEVSNR